MNGTPSNDNIWIELNKEGVVGIHGSIEDTPFLSLICPAITHLDRTIRDLGSFTTSKQFAEIVKCAVEKMGDIGPETAAIP